MDNHEIDTLVQTVLRQMGYAGGAAPVNVAPAATATAPARAVTPSSCLAADGDCLPDSGSDEFKNWIGVEQPNNRQVLEELRRATRARVCVGRSGPRPRTPALLRFLADHSRSKDTVLKEIPAEWVTRAGLFEVQSQATDKDEYLTRPEKRRGQAPRLQARRRPGYAPLLSGISPTAPCVARTPACLPRQ